MKKLILGTIIGMFAVASVASAAGLTQQQIDAVLGLLRAFGADATVVANVESALTGQTVPTAPAVWCHSFNTNMGVGHRGIEVAELHTALKKAGFSIPYSDLPQKDGETVADTYFGENTASIVVAFQEKYRYEILTSSNLSHGTGYVGHATRKQLNQLYGCGVGLNLTPPLLTATASQLVLAAWGTCQPGECRGPVVTVSSRDGKYFVSALYNNYDDSTAETKKEAVATYSNGIWMLGIPMKTWKCHVGRGHQDFNTQSCF